MYLRLLREGGMDSGGNGTGEENGETELSGKVEREIEEESKPVGEIRKVRLIRSRPSSRDITPVLSPPFGNDVSPGFSPRIGNDETRAVSPRLTFTKRQSLLVRENSIDLDSPRSSCRSVRNIFQMAAAATALKNRRSQGPMLSDVKMSSVDLDEVEVFRSGPSREDREEKPNLPHDQEPIEEEEEVYSASDLASGESIVYSTRLLADYARDEIAVDCGGCEELEIRVKALEHEIDALRAAVDAACSARKLGSAEDKKKSWADRIFGCDTDPVEERVKLVCEMEPLLKAVNFMYRKTDEVQAKCRNLKQ